MRDWFESLAERERVMVITAAGFVAFAVLYFAIWLPFDRGHKTTAASVDMWRSSLAELRPLSGRPQNSGSGPAPTAGRNESLVVIIDNTLRQRALKSALQRSQPTSANGIRVELENAAFDDLMLWLGDLDNTYGMQVQSGNFSRSASDAAGRVNSSLTLER